MLKDLHTLTPYLDFIRTCNADPDYRDPMLLTQQQLHRNLLDAPENPNTRVFGTFEGETLTGVFALLVLEDERYLELLAGLSRSAAAYAELLSHLKSAHPGYQADFVYNPRNRLLQEALAALVMLGFGKAAADKVVKIACPVPGCPVCAGCAHCALSSGIPGAVSGAAHRGPLLDGRKGAGRAGGLSRSACARSRRGFRLHRPDPQQHGK